jgi:phage terminase Nu1 subunit (DNA packaging protein)
MDQVQQVIEEINKNSIYKKKIALNTLQTSELLGVSSGTLENWRRQGIGPGYLKMSGGKKAKVMYPKTAIAEWLTNTIKTA